MHWLEDREWVTERVKERSWDRSVTQHLTEFGSTGATWERTSGNWSHWFFPLMLFSPRLSFYFFPSFSLPLMFVYTEMTSVAWTSILIHSINLQRNTDWLTEEITLSLNLTQSLSPGCGSHAGNVQPSLPRHYALTPNIVEESDRQTSIIRDVYVKIDRQTDRQTCASTDGQTQIKKRDKQIDKMIHRQTDGRREGGTKRQGVVFTWNAKIN